MSSSRCPAARTPLKVLCAWMYVFYYTVFLASWPISVGADRRRCGTDLLSDLVFVCGDRGIYLGKGNWSGYGAKPRKTGIVDQCCRKAGCDLHYLEMYCDKPKRQAQTTAFPTTTTAAQTDKDAQFEAVFHKRLLEHMGAPNSAKREAYRKSAQPSPPTKASRRRINAPVTGGPPSVRRRPKS